MTHLALTMVIVSWFCGGTAFLLGGYSCVAFMGRHYKTSVILGAIGLLLIGACMCLAYNAGSIE